MKSINVKAKKDLRYLKNTAEMIVERIVERS